MRPLWLDFQRADPGRRRPGVLLLGAGVLAAGLLFGYFANLVDQVDVQTQQLSRLKRAEARYLEQDVSGPGRARSGDAAAAGHTAVQWESLFAALEAASGDRVTLLALRPGRSEVVISGEAKDLSASTDYVRRLQAAPVLADVHVTSSALVLDHPQRPLRFALRASWSTRGQERQPERNAGAETRPGPPP